MKRSEQWERVMDWQMHHPDFGRADYAAWHNEDGAWKPPSVEDYREAAMSAAREEYSGRRGIRERRILRHAAALAACMAFHDAAHRGDELFRELLREAHALGALRRVVI